MIHHIIAFVNAFRDVVRDSFALRARLLRKYRPMGE